MTHITKRLALQIYHRNNGATVLVLFFTYKHILYRVELTRILPQWVRWEKPRKKQRSRALRLYLLNSDKETLISKYGAQPVAYADATFKQRGNLNRGEYVEFCEAVYHANTEYLKDHTPWWVSGDVINNGRSEQVKYQNATVCTEEQVLRFI